MNALTTVQRGCVHLHRGLAVDQRWRRLSGGQGPRRNGGVGAFGPRPRGRIACVPDDEENVGQFLPDPATPEVRWSSQAGASTSPTGVATAPRALDHAVPFARRVLMTPSVPLAGPSWRTVTPAESASYSRPATVTGKPVFPGRPRRPRRGGPRPRTPSARESPCADTSIGRSITFVVGFSRPSWG